MAQIINYDPEDNPKLQEIYQILLLAGYFRIRISSLKAFDKVIGGIAWCITSSNFEIEVQYNDEMQIGQKIKVSEHICRALKNMKCPYDLQPFQLQGLDVNNIFPVVQWLIKFVYETRFQRQKYNRQIACIEANKIVSLESIGNKEVIKKQPIKRTKINKAVMETSHHNPIRVYSALLEYNDITSLRMYNKLHNMMLNKKQRAKQKKVYNTEEEINEQVENDFLQIMNPDKQKEEKEHQEAEVRISFEHFSQVQTKIKLEKLQKIIEQSKQQYQTALKEPINQENSEDNLLQKFKQQSHQYQEQIKALKLQLDSLHNTIQKNNQIKENLQQKKQVIKEKMQKRMEKYRQIQEYGQDIQEELKSQKVKQKNMEQLVEKKIKLKEKKAEVKKKANAKLQQLEEKRRIVEATIPQIDEEVFAQMMEEAQIKKEIFDKKYEQLTLINQQLAILQRKAENYTSAPQIAQYHQRFVELFEAINLLIQEKRSIYEETTTLDSIQKLVHNYQVFLNDARQGIHGAKNKQHKKQLTSDLEEVYMGFEKNLSNSKLSLKKVELNMEKTYSQYSKLIKLEREYMKKLRDLKLEYQSVEKTL